MANQKLDLDGTLFSSELGAFQKYQEATYQLDVPQRTLGNSTYSFDGQQAFSIPSESYASLLIWVSFDGKWYANPAYMGVFNNSYTIGLYQIQVTYTFESNQFVLKYRQVVSNATQPAGSYTAPACQIKAEVTFFNAPYVSGGQRLALS